jgi:hypothetical protein
MSRWQKEVIPMSQAKYYSPKIRRDLVSKLYWKAQLLDVPMTQLVDWIVAEGLGLYRTTRSKKDQSGGDETVNVRLLSVKTRRPLVQNQRAFNSGDVPLICSRPFAHPPPSRA